MQRTDEYKVSEQASTLAARMYKSATDLILTQREREREANTALSEPTYMSDRKGHNSITEGGTATTLTAQEKERPLVAAVDCRNGVEDAECNASLQSRASNNINSNNVVREHDTMTSVVRRLTPMECERLQGMPDNWSKNGINEKGEVYELADSARYRLQGNGIATPWWRHLLKRISAQYEYEPTLGSLFSGQGSFEYLWESINGKGTAVWSSELEKHAIAVCKYHFPEETAK